MRAHSEWQGVVHLNEPNTVTVTRAAPVPNKGRPSNAPPLPVPAGPLGVTVYQGVPFAEYPLPPNRMGTYPFQTGDFRTTELDSRTLGANGTFSFSATTGPQAGFELDLVGPGLIDLSIDGQHLQTYGSYDYGTQDDGYPLSAAALAARYGVHVPNGRRVTVRVTASHFAGPYWRVTGGTSGS